MLASFIEHLNYALKKQVQCKKRKKRKQQQQKTKNKKRIVVRDRKMSTKETLQDLNIKKFFNLGNFEGMPIGSFCLSTQQCTRDLYKINAKPS